MRAQHDQLPLPAGSSLREQTPAFIFTLFRLVKGEGLGALWTGPFHFRLPVNAFERQATLNGDVRLD